MIKMQLEKFSIQPGSARREVRYNQLDPTVGKQGNRSLLSVRSTVRLGIQPKDKGVTVNAINALEV
jgi:hypothetical protein